MTSPQRASTARSRAILVFVDGVGIAPGDPETNPFVHAPLDRIRTIFGGRRPVTEDLGDGRLVLEGALLGGLDARMGIDGLPQSGTGQSAILTGQNTAQTFGRHFGPWVPTSLRPELAAGSLFARFPAMGIRVRFANAYPSFDYQPPVEKLRRPGAFPLAALAAGALAGREAEVRSGRALVSSITTGRWRQMVDPAAPEISPTAAAAILLALHAESDLTVFAHYDTDYIGHRQGMPAAVEALEKLDAFLGSLAAGLPADTLLLVVSDHGNLEVVGAGHTHNPALLIAVGKGHEHAVPMRSVSDIAPMLAGLLSGERGEIPRGSESEDQDYLKR